jgi:hypothetical protein
VFGTICCFWQEYLPCTGCSSCGVLSTLNGTFSDGSGAAANYVDNANCKWIIAPYGATQVTVSFTQFSTEPGSDTVTIFSCFTAQCDTGFQLAELSSTYSTTQTFTSATGYMQIHFTSDQSVTSDGFTASWTSSSRQNSTLETAPVLSSVGDLHLSCLCKANEIIFAIMEMLMHRTCTACNA